MSNSIRTFIAIKIKPENELRRVITILQEELGDETIKWVEQNNLHLTLKFLGETQTKDIVEIETRLQKLVVNRLSFKINLNGLGFFKNKGQPSVLFVNTDYSEPLSQIAADIASLLEEFGFERKKKNRFKPHLTLARIKKLKDKTNFHNIAEKFRETKFQEVCVSEVVFYQSVLQPRGSVYKPIATVKLKN